MPGLATKIFDHRGREEDNGLKQSGTHARSGAGVNCGLSPRLPPVDGTIGSWPYWLPMRILVVGPPERGLPIVRWVCAYDPHQVGQPWASPTRRVPAALMSRGWRGARDPSVDPSHARDHRPRSDSGPPICVSTTAGPWKGYRCPYHAGTSRPRVCAWTAIAHRSAIADAFMRGAALIVWVG